MHLGVRAAGDPLSLISARHQLGGLLEVPWARQHLGELAGQPAFGQIRCAWSTPSSCVWRIGHLMPAWRLAAGLVLELPSSSPSGLVVMYPSPIARPATWRFGPKPETKTGGGSAGSV